MTDKSKVLNYKFICVEVIAIILFIVFAVCIRTKPVRDDVSFDELSQAVLSAAGAEKNTIQSDVQGLRKYYGLDGIGAEFALFLPASNMDAAELLFMICKDEEQAHLVESAMNERLNNQIKVFESYGVDQMKLLNNAVVCVRGRYALLAVCSEAEAVKKEFLSVVEGE